MRSASRLPPGSASAPRTVDLGRGLALRRLGCDVFARPSRRLRRAGFAALLEAALIVFRGPEGRPDNAVYRPVLSLLRRVTDALAHLRARLADAPAHTPLTAFCRGAPAGRPIARSRCEWPSPARLSPPSSWRATACSSSSREMPFATITLGPHRGDPRVSVTSFHSSEGNGRGRAAPTSGLVVKWGAKRILDRSCSPFVELAMPDGHDIPEDTPIYSAL